MILKDLGDPGLVVGLASGQIELQMSFVRDSMSAKVLAILGEALNMRRTG